MRESAFDFRSGSVDDYEINAEDFNGGEALQEGKDGEVFRGVDKRTQALVAMKVFLVQPADMEEIFILQKCQNERIVKLLAAGTMKEGAAKGRFVFILEYCCHGSLEQFLENIAPRGLDDEKFLRLLECIRSAYECLRQHQILHRDIKPGNIFVADDKDKKLCFKLADFETERETKFGQKWEEPNEFYTVGTPLYWHLRGTSKAIRQNASTTETDHTYIDMWAIGTTLYEAATGARAFQPAETRRNTNQLRNALNRAFNQMQDGVISMKEKDDGEWKQSTQLPKGIQMSRQLKHIVTPLIARLLNKSCDPTKSVEFVMGYAEAMGNMEEPLTQMRGLNEWKQMTLKNENSLLPLPPLMLPADLRGWMVELCLQWIGLTFGLFGVLLPDDQNAHAPASISVPMSMELTMKGKVTFSNHHKFIFEKPCGYDQDGYEYKPLWVISSDIDENWPMPTKLIVVKALPSNKNEAKKVDTQSKS